MNTYFLEGRNRLQKTEAHLFEMPGNTKPEAVWAYGNYLCVEMQLEFIQIFDMEGWAHVVDVGERG